MVDRRDMEAVDMARIADDHRASGQLFYEFVRAPRLSVGLYVLPAGATDPPSGLTPRTKSTTWSKARVW